MCPFAGEVTVTSSAGLQASQCDICCEFRRCNEVACCHRLCIYTSYRLSYTSNACRSLSGVAERLQHTPYRSHSRTWHLTIDPSVYLGAEILVPQSIRSMNTSHLPGSSSGPMQWAPQSELELYSNIFNLSVASDLAFSFTTYSPCTHITIVMSTTYC